MADIETKRLSMISWSQELADAAIYNKEKLGQLLGCVIPSNFPNDPVRQHVLPQKVNKLRNNPEAGQWSGIIVHQNERTVIGSMGFKSPPEAGNVEIGYDIIPAYQGNGYATEMARGFIKWAFQKEQITRIEAECLKSNTASIRVLEKIGMRRIGNVEGMIYWEILKKLE